MKLKLWVRFLVLCVFATMFGLLSGCGGGGGAASGGLTTYSIAGQVTSNGAGLAGVTVSNGSTSATTDANGNYTLNSIANGSCTVTPALAGYTFTPATRTMTVNGANLSGQNFTATLTATVTYAVAGTITSGGSGLAGVTVSTSDGSATTNASGAYTINGLANGSYTLTPAKTGYIFNPATLPVTVNNANVTGKDFTATTTAAVTYAVAGTITSNGSGLAGVTVSTSDGSATTNASGTYTIYGLANGSYTLTPVKTGYTFTPATLAVTVSNADVTGKSFIAAVSGGGGTGVIQLPKTGQTTWYAAGDDGATQRGVAWPIPRFTDNNNGTVTDNLTGLIWLKNANCFGTKTWSDSLSAANTLAAPACGLSDGSTAGQWRLPNRKELQSLVDRFKYDPALPAGHPFSGVQSGGFWSSSSYAGSTDGAWFVGMYSGGVLNGNKAYTYYYVRPVRAGQ